MKFDLSKKVLDYEDKPIKDKINGEERDLLFSDVFRTVVPVSDETDTAEAKTKVFELSTRVFKGSTLELSAEEVTFVNNRFMKFGTALVAGRVREFLDSPLPKKDGGKQAASD